MKSPGREGPGLSQCVRFVRVTGETLLPHSVRMPSGSQRRESRPSPLSVTLICNLSGIADPQMFASSALRTRKRALGPRRVGGTS